MCHFHSVYVPLPIKNYYLSSSQKPVICHRAPTSYFVGSREPSGIPVRNGYNVKNTLSGYGSSEYLRKIPVVPWAVNSFSGKKACKQATHVFAVVH